MSWFPFGTRREAIFRQKCSRFISFATESYTREGVAALEWPLKPNFQQNRQKVSNFVSPNYAGANRAGIVN